MSDFDLKGIFEAAQRIQGEMARVKGELGDRTVAGETGGGLVSCVANGRGELVALTIDPSLLGPVGDTHEGGKINGKKMLEDLVIGAVNVALDKARQLAQEEIAKATGGLPLPPGMFGG